MRPLLFAILSLLLMLTACSSEMTPQQRAFLEDLEREKLLKSFEVEKIVADSFFTSLYDVHRARYRLKRGEHRAGFYKSATPSPNDPTAVMLDLLKKHALVDAEVHARLTTMYTNSFADKRYLSESISDNLELTQYLYEWERYQVSLEGDALVSYWRKLQKLDLVKVGLDEAQPHSKADVVQRLQSVVQIPLHFTLTSISEAYEQAFNKLEALHPALEVVDFKLENSPDFPAEKVRISCRRGQRGYAIEVYHPAYFADSSENKTLERYFFRLFNKVLTDQGEDLRLMALELPAKEKITIVALNAQQYAFLRSEYDRSGSFRYLDSEWFRLSVAPFENPFELLSQDTTVRFLAEMDKIGMFAHLDAKEKAACFQRAVEGLHADHYDLLFEAGQIFDFYYEFYPLERPYAAITQVFADASRGTFAPTDVVDDFNIEAATVNFGFTLNGQVYHKQLQVMGDSYDYAFLDLIKQAIAEQNLPGKFYQLGEMAEGEIYTEQLGYIFLNSEQYDYFKDRDFLSFLE